MIAASTGEVSFEEGLRITAHASIGVLLGLLHAQLLEAKVKDTISSKALPIAGWRQYTLGEFTSAFGNFVVEITTGVEGRVEGVFLSHCHSFYDTPAPDDSERRVFHDGIIGADLAGQREFSWGQVFCRLDRETGRDWLVVVYSPFAAVPLREDEVYKVLFAREPNPDAD